LQNGAEQRAAGAQASADLPLIAGQSEDACAAPPSKTTTILVERSGLIQTNEVGVVNSHVS
jgi:hypothetical protein